MWISIIKLFWNSFFLLEYLFKKVICHKEHTFICLLSGYQSVFMALLCSIVHLFHTFVMAIFCVKLLPGALKHYFVEGFGFVLVSAKRVVLLLALICALYVLLHFSK